MKNWGFLWVVFLMMSFDGNRQQQNSNDSESENATMVLAEETNNKVIFMGNSIIEGWPGFRPKFFENNPFINKGIGGQTTTQMLERFQRDVIDLNPKAVVILAGINDIAENTGPIPIASVAQNIFAMAEMAKKHHIQAVLCSTLPAHDFPWRPGLSPETKVPKLNALLEKYAQENNLIYINYFTAMVDAENGLQKELGYDGVHPNAAGYAVMETLLEQGLALLQKK